MLRYLRLAADWFVALFHRCPEKGMSGKGGRPFYVIGHRGSPAKEVENTIASCEVALDVDGANALEVDLCITKDGVVVLWHDWDPESDQCLARRRGLEPDVKYCPCIPKDERYVKPINQLTFDEFIEHYGYSCKDDEYVPVDAYIPSFEEFMQWAVTKKGLQLLFLDVKIPEDAIEEVDKMMKSIEQTIERHPPHFRIVIESCTPAVCDAMKRRSPHRSYSLDVEPTLGVVLDPSIFSAVHAAIVRGNQFATPMRPRSTTVAPWTTYKRIVKHDIRLRNQHNVEAKGPPVEGVICFTVNTESEMRCLIRIGVDGMQSDKPELLRRVALELGRIAETREQRVHVNAPERPAIARGKGQSVLNLRH